MEKIKKSSLSTLKMFTLLMIAVVTFSQCKKSNDADYENSLNGDLEDTSSAIAAISPDKTGSGTIDFSRVSPDGGFSYQIKSAPLLLGDSPEQPKISKMRIFEDGKELGPAHTNHQEIRNLGKGRFSHWLTSLYISASDNTDPRTNGRKYTYSYGIDAPTVTPPTTEVPPTTTPPTTTDGIIGYAMVGGSTTGGKGGSTVTVTSLSALKTAISGSTASIVQVSGRITGTGYLMVGSNKTIIGLSGSSLEGVALTVSGQSNVIIKNMTIRNVVGYSNITITEGAHHVWVDHCTLSSDRTKGWDYYDGLLDVGRKANYVTLSWNKLHDNHIPLLIGFGDTSTIDAQYLNVTVYKNYFYNVSERQPSVRFGHVHVFNNYFKASSGYSIASRMGAVVRTDNNYFESANAPIRTDVGPTPGYISGAATNYYKNSGQNVITTSASSWVPTYEYKSQLIAATDVATVVANGAGAK
ncbi:pectate lyase family protein [Pedobacter nyackensis]|nr:pectate lyase [Pedobacter nyackensis]